MKWIAGRVYGCFELVMSAAVAASCGRPIQKGDMRAGEASQLQGVSPFLGTFPSPQSPGPVSYENKEETKKEIQRNKTSGHIPPQQENLTADGTILLF